jgi:hypothetical protein
MTRKPNKRQRANNRLVEARENATALGTGLDDQRRVPLAGFEALYEITRDGHVYSVRASRFIQWAYFEKRSYIKIQVNGHAAKLSIRDAIDASWADVPPQLYLVNVPATTYVVYARDEREGLAVALDAVREEAGDGRIKIAVIPVQRVEEIPPDWIDSYPYTSSNIEPLENTVEELVRSLRTSARQRHSG